MRLIGAFPLSLFSLHAGIVRKLLLLGVRKENPFPLFPEGRRNAPPFFPRGDGEDAVSVHFFLFLV